MEIINSLHHEITQLIMQMPYFWITVFMAAESTLIPIPSEIIMIPAWFYAAQWKLNIYWAIVAWVIWNVIWAILFYRIWKHWWERLINKFFGKKEDQSIKWIYNKSKEYIKGKCRDMCDMWNTFFHKNWDIGIFVSRMLPGVRHVISFPAWVFKMNFKKFVIFTFLGSLVWVICLTYFGWYFGENQELMHKYKLYFVLWVILLLILLVWFKMYIFKKFSKNK